MTSLKKAISVASEAVADLTTINTGLILDLTANDEIINKHADTIANLRQDLSARYEEIQELEGTIADLKQDLADCNAWIDEVYDELEGDSNKDELTAEEAKGRFWKGFASGALLDGALWTCVSSIVSVFFPAPDVGLSISIGVYGLAKQLLERTARYQNRYSPHRIAPPDASLWARFMSCVVDYLIS